MISIVDGEGDEMNWIGKILITLSDFLNAFTPEKDIDQKFIAEDKLSTKHPANGYYEDLGNMH